VPVPSYALRKKRAAYVLLHALAITAPGHRLPTARGATIERFPGGVLT
jgi:hypothetical protein